MTVNAAKVMHSQGYGIAPGCDASFVLLQARDAVDAIRLRATRPKVWGKGKLLAGTAEVVAKVRSDGRTKKQAFQLARVSDLDLPLLNSGSSATNVGEAHKW